MCATEVRQVPHIYVHKTEVDWPMSTPMPFLSESCRPNLEWASVVSAPTPLSWTPVCCPDATMAKTATTTRADLCRNPHNYDALCAYENEWFEKVAPLARRVGAPRLRWASRLKLCLTGSDGFSFSLSGLAHGMTRQSLLLSHGVSALTGTRQSGSGVTCSRVSCCLVFGCITRLARLSNSPRPWRQRTRASTCAPRLPSNSQYGRFKGGTTCVRNSSRARSSTLRT